MNPPVLTVPELIDRLRFDAANHRQLADDLEKQAASLSKIHDSYNGSGIVRVKRVEPTIETLIAVIKSRESTRTTHLADQFGVGSETIQRIIDESGGRIRNKRAGWLEVAQDSAANNQPAEETPV